MAKTVEVQAGFRLGDEPDELTVCLMVPKVRIRIVNDRLSDGM